MQKNKRIRLITTGALLMALLVGLTVFFSRQFLKEEQPDEKYISKAESDDITRYEWISMLAERYELTEYNEKTPYFEDVTSDDAHFAEVQSAAEWKVLKTGEAFDGDGYASGSFVALTAMRVIGQPKLRMYAQTKEEFSDREMLDIALTEGLIEEEMLTEGISEKQSEQILQRLHELYYGKFSPKEYLDVTYQKDVVLLDQTDVSIATEGDLAITVSEDAVKDLQVGTIIIYEDAIGAKQAGKIKQIQPDGTIDLERVGPEQFLESFTASGQKRVDFDDMVTYCRLSDAQQEARGTVVKNMLFEKQDADATAMKKVSVEKFSIVLESAEDEEDGSKYLQITLKKDDGLSYILHAEDADRLELEDDEDIKAELSVNSLELLGQTDYQCGHGWSYAEVALNMDTVLSGEVSISEEEKMLLAEIPVPMSGGTVQVNVQIYLVIGMDGSVELRAEMPFQGEVRYEKGIGFRKSYFDINVEKPSLKADCKLDLALRGEPVLSAFGCKILDAEADVGMYIEAESIIRENGQQCMDLSGGYPTVTLAVLEDEDADTLLSEFVSGTSWDIITNDKAKIKLNMHFEWLNDGTRQFVDECTYKENEEKEHALEEKKPEKKSKKKKKTHRYATTYGERNQVTAPEFSFRYPDGWSITSEDHPELNTMPWEEQIILSNERGAQIVFTRWIVHSIGGGGRFMYQFELSKAAESSFIPEYPDGTDRDMSYLAPFMVAKVKVTGELFMDTDEDFQSIDGGESYAVVPESYAGSQTAVGDSGFQEMLWFEYPQPVSFVAQSPDGRFTKDEEKDVIAILSSFGVD